MKFVVENNTLRIQKVDKEDIVELDEKQALYLHKHLTDVDERLAVKFLPKNSITKEILFSKNYNHYALKVKGSILKSLTKPSGLFTSIYHAAQLLRMAKKYPYPTKGNCQYHNSHILIDIRDKFFEYENNPFRHALFEIAFRLIIVGYEHDPYYRYRLDWFLEEWLKKDWIPRPYGQPVSQYWKEPRESNPYDYVIRERGFGNA